MSHPGQARRFHDLTAHSPASVRDSGHRLDWEIKPFPFKVYTDVPGLELPREIDALSSATLDQVDPARLSRAPTTTLAALAALLYYTAGVIRRKEYPGGGEVLFRAAASTGALYQTEVYVVAGDVEGLSAGVYHFCPGDFRLRRLRAGDVRAALATAADDATLARRPATLVFTAIFWRNTWKYQARGYRHLFWDAGTMLANALAAGQALELAPRACAGFVDEAVNGLLGLDPRREAALLLLPFGPEGPAAAPVGTLEPIAHDVLPLSRTEVDYPLVREAYDASALAAVDSVRAWRGQGFVGIPAPPSGAVVALPAPAPGTGRPLGETIQRRGSTRRFGHAAIGAGDLGAALWAAARPAPLDVPAGLVDLYLVVNAVDGVAPGSYVYHPVAHALEPLAAGDFRRQSAFMCLEQALGGDAAAVIYVLSPLDAVLAALGDRGYRVANLQAGLAGGRAYLAAYALGFGASGLTFYDADVVRFFSPHARGKDALFVTALGRPAAGGAGTVLPSTAFATPPRRS